MPTLIDLSQEIYQGMPVYPGHLATVTWEYHTHAGTAGSFESDLTYATNGIIMSDHGPTHVDSISHFDAASDAPTIDLMPLDGFAGQAICIDISSAPARTSVDPDALDKAVEASGQEVRPGDIVLFHTGHPVRHGGTPEYSTQFAGLSEASAEWIVGKGIKAFGIDTPTPDDPTSRTYPVHLMCRRERMHHYENLGDLAPVLNKRFQFMGLPLKFRGGHGSPVRAVAILDD